MDLDPAKKRAMIMSNLKQSEVLRSDWKQTRCHHDPCGHVQNRKRALLERRRAMLGDIPPKAESSETSTDSEQRSNHGHDSDRKGSL
ncbi:hypothetical protein GUITHDRAFT_156156, partial [Guillardia theta CCMP2712]